MIEQLVERIKTTVPALRLVGRAAEFQAAVESNPKVTPACYVVPILEQPGPSVDADIMQQRITVTVGVIFVVRNVGDTVGAAASADLEGLRRAVRDQVYGWVAAPGMDPFERGTGHLLTFRDGHVWWQDLFITSYFDRSVL
jgi:hypothetical protein